MYIIVNGNAERSSPGGTGNPGVSLLHLDLDHVAEGEGYSTEVHIFQQKPPYIAC
jgi:hypothetical protein